LDLRIQNTEQLADGFDPELDRICRCLLEQSPVLKTSNIDDKAAPHQDEEVFFDDYIASIHRERQHVRAKSKIYSKSRLEPYIAVIEMEPPPVKGIGTASVWHDCARYKKLNAVPVQLAF